VVKKGRRPAGFFYEYETMNAQWAALQRGGSL
jgi:hypothetical protein